MFTYFAVFFLGMLVGYSRYHYALAKRGKVGRFTVIDSQTPQ